MSITISKSEEALVQLQTDLQPLRHQLTTHPLYIAIETKKQLQVFVQAHVFAVWDFMSLLKSLQRSLTCVDVPWLPTPSPNSRYLINEIVLGEESDVDQAGNRLSHFELYLQAMQELGADTESIQQLLIRLREGESIDDLLETMPFPAGVKQFLQFTFSLIAHGSTHEICAVFTYGREDLIPAIFYALVSRLDEQFPGQLSTLKYYLERHIEVDGDHHTHLAQAMLAELCGEDEQRWQEASRAAQEALKYRLGLWDGILSTVRSE